MVPMGFPHIKPLRVNFSTGNNRPELPHRVVSRPPSSDRIATMLPYPHNLPETTYYRAVTLQQNTPRHAKFYIYTTSSIRSGLGVGSIVSLTCVSGSVGARLKRRAMTFLVASFLLWSRRMKR